MAGAQTNLAWDTLLDLSPQGGPAPLHARMAGALRAAIRDGRLAPGSVLPPSRLLATDLGCSRWAVTEAYQQLVAEGYLEARVGSGTRVSGRAGSGAAGTPRAAARPPAPVTDLAPGLPDLRYFPMNRWMGALRAAVATMPHQRLEYPDAGGEPELRTVLAGYLNRVRGAAADPENLTVCSGVTDGVLRICAAAPDGSTRGTAVAVEDPGWTRLREAIAAAGHRVVPVPVDAQGIRVEDLARYPEVRVVVVSPAHQFPTGVVLAPARRAALLDWARRVDGLIVEDDYDAEFRYDRRPVGTMQGTDPARVALAGSVSKTLSPAMGLGWLVTPSRWTDPVRGGPNPGRAAPPMLDQFAFATFLSSGGYDRHLRACRQRYRARRDALVRALARHVPGAVVSGAAAGLHLLLHPARAGGWDGPATVRAAAGAGLRIACVDQYRARLHDLDGALVLGYGNLADADVDPAVARLGVLVRGKP